MSSFKPAILTARAPFNKPSADLLLRSSDDVKFYLHKQVLCLASDFFDTMLSMPQPGQSELQDVDNETGLPLLHAAEDSDTLGALLRFCYPTVNPRFNCIANIRPVMMAAAKYQMEEMSSLLLEQLISLRDSPLRLYAVACELDLEDVAKLAARRCRAKRIAAGYVPDMDRITAGQHFRLLQFCRDCHDTASVDACTLGSWTTSFISSRRRLQSRSLDADLRSICTDASPETFRPYSHADMIIQSITGFRFYVNRYILSLASPTFERHRPLSDPFMSDLPVYRLNEHGAVIAILLVLVYPLPELKFTNLDALGAITEAAVKYDMPRVIEIMKHRWMDQIDTAPLRV